MTTEHARSNLCGAHGCMRLWVAVQKSPTLLETPMPMSKLIHVLLVRLMQTKWVRVRRERVLAPIATPEWSVGSSRCLGVSSATAV
jgi:hypothetical protein